MGGYARGGSSRAGGGGNSSRGGSSGGYRKSNTAVRAKATNIASSKLYTSSGERIRNAAAYQAAGGRAYSSSGAKIHNTKAYTGAIEASVRQNTNDPKFFYHYTDNRSASQIAASGKIKASNAGAVGKGTYLTTKPPRCSDGTLLANNYGGIIPSRAAQVQSYVKLNADKIPAKNYTEQMGRNVWKAPGDVNLKAGQAQIKDRP